MAYTLLIYIITLPLFRTLIKIISRCCCSGRAFAALPIVSGDLKDSLKLLPFGVDADVGVDVHGDADGGVAENGGQGLHLHSLSGAVGGEGVAEGVEGVALSGVEPSVPAHVVDDFPHAFVDV